MRRRRAILISVLVVFVLLVLGLSVLFAGGPTPRYDTNSSGMIEGDEAHNALRAYFDGDLTQEQALDVLFHYWAAQPVDQPPPAASSQPTPTITPTPVPLSIQAPEITFTRVNRASIQVNWVHNAENVTGYEARYRPAGGAWVTMGKEENARSASGISRGGSFLVGRQYEIQVRSLTKNGPSPWASETLVVPAPAPTLTPITPTPTPVPQHVALSNAYNNGCVGRENLPPGSGRERSTSGNPRYEYWISKVASDIRIAAMFKNPPEPERNAWEAPKLPTFKYGFMVRVVPEQGVGLLALVSSDNSWSVELRYIGVQSLSGTFRKDGRRSTEYFSQSWGTRRVLLGSGTLEIFENEPLATNHVMLEVVGDTYRFSVNGVDVPLDVDAEKLAVMEKYIGMYRHYDDGKWHGLYNITYSSKWTLGYTPRATTGGTYVEDTGRRSISGGTIKHKRSYPWVACVP